MPPPELATIFPPEMQRLLDLIETNLFFIAKDVKTREEAIAIKNMFQKPLGVLNSRFQLSSNSSWERSHSKNVLTNGIKQD